ncbi:MAG: DUF4242 domain-containing protein [Bacteriovorax sp.]|nr:DUF4242 domain-containing protein [Bacteriovorax sp.]
MLKKFIIERNIPGVGRSSEEQMREMAQKSNSVIAQLGTGIQWRESYVTDDKIYCVYMAENKDLVKEHAKKAGFPADKISEINVVMDPTSEGQERFKPMTKENITQTHMS